MEIFLDGGLFELIILIAFASIINFIFLRKYLLIVYSILTPAAPVGIFFVKNKELLDCLVTFCLFNSIILVILLWQHTKGNEPGKLIDLAKLIPALAKNKDNATPHTTLIEKESHSKL
jgi:hypothetical protein